MGNKKYYRKNNNYNKNNYYYKKNKNNKKNYYYMNKNNVNKNNIDYSVNNNLGDVNINKEDNDYTIDNEIIENDFEVVLKKKDKNIDDNTISFDNVEKEDIKEENQNNININVNEEVEIQKKPRKNLLIKTNLGYALGIIILLLAIVGTTYSYFNYTGNTRQADIASGDIYVKVVEDTVNLSGKLYPSTKEEARSKSDNVVTFNVKGLNTSDKTLYYEVKLNYGESKSSPYLRFNDSDLVFDLVEVNGSNETYLVNAKSFNDISTGVRIWADNIPANTTTEVTKTYKLRMWLSDKVTIDDNNGTYPASTYKNYYASIKASVFGDFQVKTHTSSSSLGSAKVLEAINTNATGTCENIIYEEDGIKYFSGTKDCINFNYVWYSGKLWRITAIYPDGAMKLVTENNITSIAFNELGNVNFENSYMYNWLNEEFYPTLYNASNIIDTTKKWNATMPADTNISTKPGNTNLVTANVGLLNSYEYYNSYRNLEGSYSEGFLGTYGYLNIGYYWWLLNPYSASYNWSVLSGGNDTGNNIDPTFARGGRPSIYLKSGLEFTGSGLANDPYKIVGDKDIGKWGDFVNTRISGEYVKLKKGSNEQLFRIIGVEDNKTKIIAMDYADNKATRQFSTSIGTAADEIWGSGTTTGTDTWYDYLNNTYLPNLKTTYGEIFDSNKYYLGVSGYNYKLSICANITSGNTKMCTKTSDNGTFNIGLPRYGEMFATQQSGGSSNSINMWLMNRYSGSHVWHVEMGGIAYKVYSEEINGGRPTLYLKSNVKIYAGSGTESNPYIIGNDDNIPWGIVNINLNNLPNDNSYDPIQFAIYQIGEIDNNYEAGWVIDARYANANVDPQTINSLDTAISVAEIVRNNSSSYPSGVQPCNNGKCTFYNIPPGVYLIVLNNNLDSLGVNPVLVVIPNENDSFDVTLNFDVTVLAPTAMPTATTTIPSTPTPIPTATPTATIMPPVRPTPTPTISAPPLPPGT